MTSPFRVFVDFDGTLVEPNVAILLVEKFCAGGKELAHEVDQQLHSGHITLREAWERQAAMLPADRVEEMRRWAVETIPLRAGAKECIRMLSDRKVPVAVVSGGLDFYIEAVLGREGMVLPFVSDRLQVNGGGQVQVLHPFGHPTCRLCGICKAQVVRSSQPANQLTIFIGDGSTDRYGAEVADIVFARHRLKGYCERARIPFVPFENFHEVNQKLTAWLDGRDDLPRRTSLGLSQSPCPISQSLAISSQPSRTAATRAEGAPARGDAREGLSPRERAN